MKKQCDASCNFTGFIWLYKYSTHSYGLCFTTVDLTVYYSLFYHEFTYFQNIFFKVMRFNLLLNYTHVTIRYKLVKMFIF